MSLKRILFAYAIWWIGWSVVHTIIIFYLGFSIEISFADSLLSNLLLAILSLAPANTLRYYQPGKSSSWNLLLWSLLLSGVCVLLSNSILTYFFSWDENYVRFLKQSFPIRYCIFFLIVTCILLLSWIWRTLLTRQEEQSRKTDIEKIARQTELESLRKQMQPHFLFNSLNSISSLIGSDPGDARKMIQKLSDFMRYTLKKESHQITDLEEEFAHLQLYLDIEKLRFGHRLNTLVNLPEKLVKKKIPFLVLQPIVENAIKFGLYGTTGECNITITVSEKNHELILQIENPFDKDSSASNAGTGFGLTAIQRRLYLLFGRNDLLQTYTVEDKFITTIIIPQEQ